MGDKDQYRDSLWGFGGVRTFTKILIVCQICIHKEARNCTLEDKLIENKGPMCDYINLT